MPTGHRHCWQNQFRDHAAHLDDDRLAVAGRGGEVCAYCLDPLAADHNITLVEVADRRDRR